MYKYHLFADSNITHEPVYPGNRVVKTSSNESIIPGEGLLRFDVCFELDIPEKNNNTAAVKKTESGNTILITDNVINFDFDSYELKDEYNDGINEIYSYLNNNKNAILIIEGHADSIGDSNYNIYLSENRARAIFDELREKGIERRRLRYIGYGSTRSDQNYDKNRKCQFVVINSADEEKAYKEKNETDTIKLKR